MNLSLFKHIYFLGVGGIGMSALARYFLHRGKRVSGYDKTETELTKALAREGAVVHYHCEPENLPDDIDLVVYTPAITENNTELKELEKRGVPIKKRAEVLGLITKGKYTIAVAGTHGKTTISSMIAHILKESGTELTAFLGGVNPEMNSNFIAGEEPVVVEADEYDRSFLHLSPDIAVITSTDADHLDIYKNAESVKDSFQEFVNRIKPDGILLKNEKIEPRPNKKNIKVYTYGENPSSDFRFSEIRLMQNSSEFVFEHNKQKPIKIRLSTGGRHNIENATAAISACLLYGSDIMNIVGIESFKGVKRRFEYIVKNKDKVYIDDYAHHPTELRALIVSVKETYPDESLTIIFQPHLYSRTRDFAAEFAESLSLADRVILLPIYPAREAPIKGVSSNIILEKIKTKEKYIMEKDKLLSFLSKEKPSLLVSAGAGDIGEMTKLIANALE